MNPTRPELPRPGAVPYRILVTGSRRLRDDAPIREAFAELAHLWLEEQRVVVVHGGAEGCDTLVRALIAFDDRVYEEEAHPAIREKFGPWPGAGPRRNSHMVSLGARLCIAFPCPKSTGTPDCYRKAIRAGIPTHVYPVRP